MVGSVALVLRKNAPQTVDVLNGVCANVMNSVAETRENVMNSVTDLVSAWPPPPKKTKSQMALCDLDALYLPDESLVTLE